MLSKVRAPGRLGGLIAGLAVCAAVTTVPMAGEGAYAGGAIGAVFVQDSTVDDDFGNHFTATLDTGFTIAGLGGYDFGRFRVDGHARYLITELDEFELPGGGVRARGDLQMASVIINGWIDFENASRLTPYVGAGVGAAAARVSDIRSMGSRLYASDTTNAFAYQACAGLSIDVGEKGQLDAGYAYHATSDPGFESATAEFHSSMVTLGFRYLIGTGR